MLHKLFAIRDSKTEFFGPPWAKSTHGEAERDFTTLVNDPQSQIFNYPQDYDLYLLGEYDSNTGKITPEDTPKHCLKAVQIKKAQD